MLGNYHCRVKEKKHNAPSNLNFTNERPCIILAES